MDNNKQRVPENPDDEEDPNKTTPPLPVPPEEPLQVGAARNQSTQIYVPKNGVSEGVGGLQSQTLGDYRIIKSLGSGGMGTVYLAHQLSRDRDVALKVMSPVLARMPAQVERFQREGELMFGLHHPNIVRCFDRGEVEGWHYFAMEYVDGGTLHQWLDKVGHLSVPDALHVVLACARALQHLHDQQLVHRDVKTDNVLLTRWGGVKLADLGLLKSQDQDMGLTQTGTVAGTPTFMAPEQARDVKRADGRCDIYSLGCVLYCCLTGDIPFQGSNVFELLEAKEKGRFPPARRRNSDVPERLDLILQKMLAPRPEYRYQTCNEVIQALEGMGLASKEFKLTEPPTRSAPLPTPAKSEPAPRLSSSSKQVARSRPLPPPPPPSRKPPRPAPVLLDNEKWYVTYTQSDGQLVTRELSTREVIHLIRSKHFDPETQASQTPSGEYRKLSSYQQFEPWLQKRLARREQDLRNSSFRKIYAEIDADRRQQKKESRAKRQWTKITPILTVLIWGAIGFGILVLIAKLIYFLVNKM